LRQICRLRSCAVAVDDYNRKVIRALEAAQQTAEIRSAAAFARALGARSGGPPDASTYQRWLRGDSLVPAWALLAAADEAGQTIDSLLGSAPDDRLAQLERRIEFLESEGRPRSPGNDWLDVLEQQAEAQGKASVPESSEDPRSATGE
jgi:hypothetical protein